MRHASLVSLQAGLVAGMFVAGASTSAAQADPTPVGEHVRLRVAPAADDRYARTRWKGTLVKLDADSVVLRTGRRTHAWPRQSLERMDALHQALGEVRQQEAAEAAVAAAADPAANVA